MNFNDLNNTTPNNLNVPNTTLLDTIHVERGIIPANLCDFIVQDTEKREWKPHTWYNSVQDTYGSEETKELDVQACTPELQQLLTPIIIQAGAAYNQTVSYTHLTLPTIYSV